MKLKKELSTFDIFCIASGVMISSGIFILPGLAFEKAGPAVFLSYGIAGMAALIGVMSIIELSTAMPKAGGDYFYITRSIGPLPGIIAGFFSWLSLSLKTAFAIFGIGEILHSITGLSLIPLAIATTVFFVLLNIVGVGIAAKVEVAIVVGLLLIMALYIVLGTPHIQTPSFVPLAPNGIDNVFLTAGFVFVSFGGLLKVATLAEEVKTPKISMPLGILGALAVVTLMYALMLIVLVGTSDPAELSKSLRPFADSARDIAGMPGFYFLIVAAGLSFVSTANAGIMSASRYPVALSKDSLLPPVFSRISKHFKTPIIAILITGLLISLSFFLPLEKLVKIASSVIIASYIFTNISIIIIRASKLQNYQPSFSMPLYPLFPISSIVLFVLLLVEIGVDSLEVVGVTLVVCLLFYLFYGRKHFNSEYALLYLIERVISKDMTSYNLEGELRDILHQRDDVFKDNIHSLFDEAPIIDYDEKMTAEELFDKVAPSFCKRINKGKISCTTLLKEREKSSPTALNEFLAIPHIVLQGEDIFELIVIRNKKGIYFNEKTPSIKAVFIMMGTSDRRNDHLQALSAIAQITHNEDFEKKWMSARSENHLRDILLLGERKRHTD